MMSDNREWDKLKRDNAKYILEKGEVILTVKINNIADAEQIVNWQLPDGPISNAPMTAELLDLHTDCVPVNRKISAILDTLINEAIDLQDDGF